MRLFLFLSCLFLLGCEAGNEKAVKNFVPAIGDSLFIARDTLVAFWQQSIMEQVQQDTGFEQRKRLLIDLNNHDSVKVMLSFNRERNFIEIFQRNQFTWLGSTIIRDSGIYLQPGIQVGSSRATLEQVLRKPVEGEVVQVGNAAYTKLFTLFFRQDTLDAFVFRNEENY